MIGSKLTKMTEVREAGGKLRREIEPLLQGDEVYTFEMRENPLAMDMEIYLGDKMMVLRPDRLAEIASAGSYPEQAARIVELLRSPWTPFSPEWGLLDIQKEFSIRMRQFMVDLFGQERAELFEKQCTERILRTLKIDSIVKPSHFRCLSNAMYEMIIDQWELMKNRRKGRKHG